MEFPKEKEDPEETPPPEEGISFKDLKEILKEAPTQAAERKAKPGSGATEGTASAEAAYRRAIIELERFIAALLEGKPPDLSPLIRIASDFVEALSSNSALLMLALSFSEAPFYPLLNAVNSAILAIKIGTGLGYPKEERIKLGLAALLHDVGSWKIPRDLILKGGRLSEEEREKIRKHPIYSRDLLRLLPPEYAWLPETAYQEHEREHGEGYPSGIKGEGIGEFARIIGLVDAYEAITHQRPYRPARTPAEALKELIDFRKRDGYPWNLLKTLVREISVFPPGSWVVLNSGETARVVETNPLSPLRPTVEIRFDSAKRRVILPKIVELEKDPLLHITGSLLPTALPEEV